MKKLRMYQEQKIIGLDRKNTNPGSKSNLVIYQVNAATPFELDVVFESGSSDQLRKGKDGSKISEIYKETF